MLHGATSLLRDLEVDVERMRENLWVTKGFVFSEAIMMELARRGLGKQVAYKVMHEAANQCYADGTTLQEALQDDIRVTTLLSRDDLAALMDPASYLGTIPEQIAQARHRATSIIASLNRNLRSDTSVETGVPVLAELGGNQTSESTEAG
jgi:adenylosuccinate lyase